MGSTCGCLSTKPLSSSDTLRELQTEKKNKDSQKVQKFKKRVELKKSMSDRKNTLEILQEEIEDLGVTKEPITDFYVMDVIIGSGKYGVVKRGVSIDNPDFRVAIKIIDLAKLNSQFHSLIQEILTLK